MNPCVSHWNINNRIFVAKNFIGKGTVVGYSYVERGGGIIKCATEFPVNSRSAVEVINSLANMAEKIGGITTEELRRLADILENE